MSREKEYSPVTVLPVLVGFGMQVHEGNHAVLALQDILLPDNAPVKVSAKINDRLVTVADIFD